MARIRVRKQTVRNKFFINKEMIKDSHPHIIDWFDTEQRQSVQTEIIVNCFTKSWDSRGGNLRWVMDLDKPFFNESKTRCVSIMEAYMGL